jgi:hypothetical protein
MSRHAQIEEVSDSDPEEIAPLLRLRRGPPQKCHHLTRKYPNQGCTPTPTTTDAHAIDAGA